MPQSAGRGVRGLNVIACLKYVPSLCNEISTSTFDLRLALLVPLNLKLLPTRLCLQALCIKFDGLLKRFSLYRVYKV